MVAAKMAAPPSGRSSRVTEVITTWRSSRRATASARRVGSVQSTSPGRPVVTSQNPQLRVHTSPSSRNDAVRNSPQHSPIFGTGRLLANRVQALLAHQLLELLEVRSLRQAHLEPVGPRADDGRRGLGAERLGARRSRSADQGKIEHGYSGPADHRRGDRDSGQAQVSPLHAGKHIESDRLGRWECQGSDRHVVSRSDSRQSRAAV